MKIAGFLSRFSKTALIILGYALVLNTGLADMLYGENISFTIFYLVPIALISWHLGKWHGLAGAIISSAFWTVSHLRVSTSYPHPVLFFVNSLLVLVLFVSVNQMFAKYRELKETEKKFTRTDSLTKVANANAFSELAELEIRRTRRYKRPVTLLYLDLDRFKKVNENSGLQAGNTLLFIVAYTIDKNIREVDTVARIGGDEFVVLLPNTGFESSDVVVNRIRQAINYAMKENDWNVTVSIGAATFNKPPVSSDDMLIKASHLALKAQEEGGDRIEKKEFNPGDEEKKALEAS